MKKLLLITLLTMGIYNVLIAQEMKNEKNAISPETYTYLDLVFMGSNAKPAIKAKYYPIFHTVLTGITEINNSRIIPAIYAELNHQENKSTVLGNYYNLKGLPYINELIFFLQLSILNSTFPTIHK